MCMLVYVCARARAYMSARDRQCVSACLCGVCVCVVWGGGGGAAARVFITMVKIVIVHFCFKKNILCIHAYKHFF